MTAVAAAAAAAASTHNDYDSVSIAFYVCSTASVKPNWGLLSSLQRVSEPTMGHGQMGNQNMMDHMGQWGWPADP
jgi:hypothetical protein